MILKYLPLHTNLGFCSKLRNLNITRVAGRFWGREVYNNLRVTYMEKRKIVKKQQYMYTEECLKIGLEETSRGQSTLLHCSVTGSTVNKCQHDALCLLITFCLWSFYAELLADYSSLYMGKSNHLHSLKACTCPTNCILIISDHIFNVSGSFWF